MLIFKDAKPDLLNTSAIALGVFDGIHKGHEAVIKTMLTKAQENNLASCVVTFSNHPFEILQKTFIPSVISLEKRLEIMQKLGVDAVLVLDFSKELLSLSADGYLREILVKSLHPRFITLGFNHFFGANKKGNAEFLQNNAQKYGYEVLSIPPVKIGNETVSSSLIKKCIAQSNFEKANLCLGRDFSVEGEVVKGREIGHTIGFATANIVPATQIIDIPNGVYAGWTFVNGKKYKSVVNVGIAPTLKNSAKTIETHLLNFDKDIYGQKIEIGFIKKIRNERKFDSKEELIEQIKKDCSYISNL